MVVLEALSGTHHGQRFTVVSGAEAVAGDTGRLWYLGPLPGVGQRGRR